MASPKVELVLDVDNYLGETPVWSAGEQALYWVNCEDPFELHRWKPATGARDVWPMTQRVGGFVLAPGGRAVVALWDGLYDFNPADGSISLRVRSPLPEHVALHESGTDRQGRLWIGAYDHHFTPTNRDAHDGAFCRLDGDRLTPVIPRIAVANGLAFSPDGRTIYASDSPTRTVDAYDLDPATGELSNKRRFLALADGEGYVDGATVDAEGGYWLAAVGAGALRRYLPDGTLDQVVPLPCSNPTKVVFGGPDLDVLYVTSTKLAFGPKDTPEARRNGGLFALKPGVKGLPEPVLAG